MCRGSRELPLKQRLLSVIVGGIQKKHFMEMYLAGVSVRRV